MKYLRLSAGFIMTALLAVVLFVNSSFNVRAEEYLAPDTPQWSQERPGEYSFQINDTRELYYGSEIYYEGERRVRIGHGMYDASKECTSWNPMFFDKSGTYTVKVFAYLSKDKREAVAESELSAEFDYVLPEQEIGAPVNLEWISKEDKILASWSAVEGAGYYYIELYKDGKYVTAHGTIGLQTDFASQITDPDEYAYTFTVTAYANDITQFAASKSDYSAVYVGTSNNAENGNSMYRLYNPNSGEHFYTASREERENLKEVGWQYEGIAWNAPAVSSLPVYRLYNPNAGDHHYTTSEEEKENLVAAGWKYEGIGWYSDENEGVPMHRLYNPNAISGAHHYTASEEERDNLTAIGWRYEGIGWFGK